MPVELRDHTRSVVQTGVESIAQAIASESVADRLDFTPATRDAHCDRIGEFICVSPAMRALFAQLRKVAPTPASVLLIGESGTGKGMAARALHRLSNRSTQPLVAVNCGSIPESLIEAELFGFERGSFSGAHKAHSGHFERAGRGTLFLDEMTEMSPDMQVKLLRVLETRKFCRVGGERELEYGCRIIAATNRDPHKAVQEGRLRSDLLYRLGGFPLSLPPLRDRPGDAALLAREFLSTLNAEHGTRKRFSQQSRHVLVTHHWPGNLRELANAIQRAYILAKDELDLCPAASAQSAVAAPTSAMVRVPIGTCLSDAEQWIVMATLEQCGGNKTRAAATLGCSLKTLYNRLHRYRAM